MIVPDVNLLVHAHDAGSRRHAAARRWWEGLMNGTVTVGLPWAAILGFVGVTTDRTILDRPLDAYGAFARVRSWLDRPQTAIVHPGERHADILFDLLDEAGTAADLTAAAHLAALAIEHQAELHSTDADMARFPGLRWRNPLGRGIGFSPP